MGVLELFSRRFAAASFGVGVVRGSVGPAPMNPDEPLPTRRRLLDRLRDVGDQASWEDFHRTYRGLLFGVARRAGLNEHEAAEVGRDTLTNVAKKMPEFRDEPGQDSFKGWLLPLTRWNVPSSSVSGGWPRRNFETKTGGPESAPPPHRERHPISKPGGIPKGSSTS